MIIEPLLLWHLQKLNNAESRAVVNGPGYFRALVDNGPTFAGLTDDGEVIGAMGFIKQNRVSYRCWAITDHLLLPRYLVAVSKKMRRSMAGLVAEKGAKRIETIVRVDNLAAERWIKLLGFSNPQLHRNYDEHGDAWLYERVS